MKTYLQKHIHIYCLHLKDLRDYSVLNGGRSGSCPPLACLLGCSITRVVGGLARLSRLADGNLWQSVVSIGVSISIVMTGVGLTWRKPVEASVLSLTVCYRRYHCFFFRPIALFKIVLLCEAAICGGRLKIGLRGTAMESDEIMLKRQLLG